MSVGNIHGGVHINPLAQPQQGGTVPQTKMENYKASSAMLSGSELVAKMGGAPKENWTLGNFTIRTHSDNYKGVKAHLENYQMQADSLKDRNLSDVPKSVISSMKDELQNVVDSAEAYIAQHANSSSKSDRRAVMQEVLDSARSELQNLGNLDKMTGVKGTQINISEGLALLRGGVTDASHFTRDLNDDIIDHDNSKLAFGAGKVNSVELIDYGGDVRVVKYMSKTADVLMKGERTIGMDPNDMRTAARNIATSNVAEHFGKPSLVPMPDVVIRDGQAALAMHKAPGESLIHKYESEVTDQKSIARFDTELSKGWMDNLKSAGVRKDEVSGKWMHKEVGFKEIPYQSQDNPKLAASVQLGMLDLQSLHCLLGQVDGQPENIYVQIKGDTAVVTGIDQDMCLGKLMDGLDTVGGQSIGDLKKTAGGPPPLMSKSFYDKLMALTPDTLDELLGPQITDEEKTAAHSRLDKFQTYARDTLAKNDRVIDDDKFETWRADGLGGKIGVYEFCIASDTGSYIKRDGSTLSKTKNQVPLDLAKHV